MSTGCFLARKRNTATNRAPSTATNTIAATIRTITYSVWIELAFGDPPDFGVMKFAKRAGGEDQAGGGDRQRRHHTQRSDLYKSLSEGLGPTSSYVVLSVASRRGGILYVRRVA